ncbi:MAG: DNA translocase FtsK [Lachnospiraceae bacterium]|nr:DNA translocase FtsK [Lachnospiraceae bacterium]
MNPLLAQEALLWLALAVCLFIFISFFGIGGYVGTVISDICFGIFGVSAYIFPFLMFLAAAFVISNRGSRLAGEKFAACALLYLCICCFASLIEGRYAEAYDIGKLYARCASLKQGGGVIGGTVCHFLGPALGPIGTGVLLGVFSLIALVLITQKSLLRGVKKQGNRVYHTAKESSERRREERRKREEWEHFERMSEPVQDTPSMRENTSYLDDTLELQQISQSHDVEYAFHTGQSGTSGRSGTYEKSGTHGKTGACRKSAAYGNTEASGSAQGDSGNRQLDVSVMFSPQSETRRKHRHASGVTMNTKITGEPGRVGTDVHEILPKAFDPADTFTPAADEPASSSGSSASDRSLSGILEGESGFINLEESVSAQTHDAGKNAGIYSGTAEAQEPVFEQYPDMKALHIEGVGITEPDLPETDSRADSRTKIETDQAPRIQTECAAESGSRHSLDDQDEKYRTSQKTSENSNVGDENESSGQEASAQGSASGRIKRNPRSSEQEIADGIASVEAEAAAIEAAKPPRPEYVFPPLDLLHKGENKAKKGQEQEIRQTAAKLQQTLNSFGVHVTVTNVSCGPSVTRYELLPEQGVKVSRIVSLADDIKLNLAAADIRIEAPIPGKSAVGIEVPNSENSAVPLRDLLESDEFRNHKSKLAFATGKDLGGKVVVSDIAKMPHLLIAGATGSGKSVCINTIIMSILYKAKPEEVKLIMIDPKVVELSVYNGIPHLFIPVVTDPKKAAGALNWGVAEMTDRYAKFAEVGVRDLKGYNQKIEALKDVDDPNKPEKLPQIVIIVDELADLMMVAPGEVEDSICRLAQLARAAGIHLIIATQRPSVNVITGLIKANMPSRIAFSVSSGVDSRTIIDMYGAEKLLGKGDMLFYPQGYQKPARVQGAFVTDEEVSDVVDFLKNSNSGFSYDPDMEQKIAKAQQASAAAKGATDTDELFADAGKFIIEKDKASIGMLQRVFKIGFNRAARIMDQLSDAGVVGPEEGTKPRKILMSQEQFENYLEEN